MALRKNRRTIYEFVILELILHDFAEHILDIKTCCTNLLRNETGNGHTWSGIDLQHVHLVVLATSSAVSGERRAGVISCT